MKAKQQDPVVIAKPKITFRKRDIVEVPRERYVPLQVLVAQN